MGSEVPEKIEEQSTPPTQYNLSVQSHELDNDRVLLEINTNIPGTIELMAGLNLAGQAQDDTWIGTSERVRIIDGTAEVIFDVSELPSGEYEAEATFYPRWGFQDDKSRASGIAENLKDTHSLTLRGSGEPADIATKRNEGQKWVMENVVMGMEWNPSDWQSRFGDWVEFPVTTRNPDIIKNYYFEVIEMTLVVNTLNDEIVTWRMGREGL